MMLFIDEESEVKKTLRNRLRSLQNAIPILLAADKEASYPVSYPLHRLFWSANLCAMTLEAEEIADKLFSLERR